MAKNDEDVIKIGVSARTCKEIQNAVRRLVEELVHYDLNGIVFAGVELSRQDCNKLVKECDIGGVVEDNMQRILAKMSVIIQEYVKKNAEDMVYESNITSCISSEVKVIRAMAKKRGRELLKEKCNDPANQKLKELAEMADQLGYVIVRK